jgi:hypothetical protein
VPNAANGTFPEAVYVIDDPAGSVTESLIGPVPEAAAVAPPVTTDVHVTPVNPGNGTTIAVPVDVLGPVLVTTTV